MTISVAPLVSATARANERKSVFRAGTYVTGIRVFPSAFFGTRDRAVGQGGAAERPERRDAEYAVRRGAVPPREPPGRAKLDTMPLAVVERQGVNRPAPARKEREAGAAVETARKEDDGGSSARAGGAGNLSGSSSRDVSPEELVNLQIQSQPPGASPAPTRRLPRRLPIHPRRPARSGRRVLRRDRCRATNASAQSKSRRSATTNFTSSRGPSRERFARSFATAIPEPGHFTSTTFTTRGVDAVERDVAARLDEDRVAAVAERGGERIEALLLERARRRSSRRAGRRDGHLLEHLIDVRDRSRRETRTPSRTRRTGARSP